MARLAALLLLVVAPLFPQSSSVHAHHCTCDVDPSSIPPATALAESDWVFRGRVTQTNTYPSQLFKFQVTAVWKDAVTEIGAIAAETIYLPGASDGCGFPFLEGREYLVYSPNDDGPSECGRTHEIGDPNYQGDLAELGSALPPDPGTEAKVYQVLKNGGLEGDVIKEYPADFPLWGVGSAVGVGFAMLVMLVWLGAVHRKKRD